jgi:hypothetical protein
MSVPPMTKQELRLAKKQTIAAKKENTPTSKMPGVGSQEDFLPEPTNRSRKDKVAQPLTHEG